MTDEVVIIEKNVKYTIAIDEDDINRICYTDHYLGFLDNENLEKIKSGDMFSYFVKKEFIVPEDDVLCAIHAHNPLEALNIYKSSQE